MGERGRANNPVEAALKNAESTRTESERALGNVVWGVQETIRFALEAWRDQVSFNEYSAYEWPNVQHAHCFRDATRMACRWFATRDSLTTQVFRSGNEMHTSRTSLG